MKMSMSKYDKLFGGDADGAYKALVAKFGAERGKRMFYAKVNGQRKQGSGKGMRAAMKAKKKKGKVPPQFAKGKSKGKRGLPPQFAKGKANPFAGQGPSQG